MNINSHQFFDLLNEADSSYLAAAHKSMTAKPARMWLRPALIAACLTLILVAIPVGILMGNRTIKPTVPVIDPNITANTVTTTQAPPSTAAPQTTARPSVLDIPGATVFDENDGRFSKPGNASTNSLSLSDEEQLGWAQHMKENNSILLGYVKDYMSVLVPEGKDYYHIATMEIQVLENISGIEKETVTAVYACRYEYDFGYYMPAGTYQGTDSISARTDQFLEAMTCTDAYVATQGKAAGLFLLKESNDQKLTFGETTYNLSDYADYILDASLQWQWSGGLWLRSFKGYYTLTPKITEEVFKKSLVKDIPYPVAPSKDSDSIVTPSTTKDLTSNTITPES